MKKRYILLIIFGIISLAVLVLTEIYYDEEEEYLEALQIIEDYRLMCESAGFNFELEGELRSPEDMKRNFDFNYVSIKCYDIKNDVRIYYDLDRMEYIPISDEVRT